MSMGKDYRDFGQCCGCGDPNYFEVCYRGNPRYGPPGPYCSQCWREADTDPSFEPLELCPSSQLRLSRTNLVTTLSQRVSP